MEQKIWFEVSERLHYANVLALKAILHSIQGNVKEAQGAFDDYMSMMLPWQDEQKRSEMDRVEEFGKEVEEGKMLQVTIPKDLLNQMVKERKSKKSRGMF